MAGTTLTTTPNLNLIYYDKKFLEMATANTVYAQVCDERPMPHNAGDIARMNVYVPKNTAAVQALSALTEATNPTASVVSSNTVSAQILEYGDYWQISSKVSLVAIDPEVERNVTLASNQAARHMDNLILTELMNATTTIGANSHTTVSTVAASDTMSIALARNAKRTLFNNFALPIDSDGSYVCVTNGDAEYDLQGDTAWKEVQYYANKPETIMRGEIGKLYGVRFLVSNNPSVESVSGGASNVKVYNSYFLGKEAVGIIKPTGKDGDAMIKIKTPGPSDTSNPLDMFATFGYKFTWAVKILNNSFIVEARHSATYTS